MFKIHTERLILSEFTVDDASFILTLLNTPTWLNNIGDKRVYDIRAATEYLLSGPIKSYKDNGFGFYKVSLYNGMPVGMCGLIKRPELDFIDIGYAILPTYEGKGFISEAAIAVATLAFATLKIEKLAGITSENNQGSIRILEKLGMKYSDKIKLKPDGPEYMLFFKELPKPA